MKEHYDFSNGRKNPYAEKLRKEGYTISIHYSPEDVEELNDFDDLDSQELTELEKIS